MYYQLATLRFECTQCGKCCIGNRNHYVSVSQHEAENICTHLDISEKWFKQRYLMKRDGIYVGIKLENDGRCPFLNNQGHCRIYPVRPIQCQTYPYWPELMDSRSAWLAEKKRCEGIDQGNRISKAHIKKMLALQEQADEDAAIE
jgi:Fe-S-cluster containining protein